MKAVVFHGVGDVRVEEVREPGIESPTDAIVRVTASAICGTDLHMVRGTLGGMRPGTILGHEAVAIVEEPGRGVRNLSPGDRVVVASTIACGSCAYCRSAYYSQCDAANPGGPRAGTAFFGGPESSGGFDGLQAEFARVPFANVGLIRLPEEVTDDQAILLSDVFPTGWFGAELAEIKSGDTVVVFGCGPVGQFAVLSALLHGASRVFAVDSVASRLDAARMLGAETVDFEAEDPVEAILELTGGVGADRAIDAVGVDAYKPRRRGSPQTAHFDQEVDEIVGHDHDGEGLHPGNAPSQVLTWAVESLAKAGTLAIIGVYPSKEIFFPIGGAVEKNLTIQMGNCPHRRYIPKLVELVRTGVVDPARIVTQREPISSAVKAYEAFEERQPGWLKVKLDPVAAA